MKIYAEQLASGNLSESSEANENDSLGRIYITLNQAIHKVGHLLSELKNGMEHVDSNSDELSATMTELIYVMEDVKEITGEMAQGSTELSASTQQISASVDQIETSTQKMTANANQGKQIAKDIKERAMGVWKEAKESAVSATEIYEEKADNISNSIKQARVVEEIKMLADTIRSIAEQTNLLALNASIEAARAGEAGKGFSVVADEIRKLAEQSTNSVNNIQQVTSQVQEAFSNLIEHSQEILDFVDSKVKPDYEKLVNIGEQYEKDSEFITSMSNEISRASDEMAAQIREVNMAMQSISATSQQSASGTEEILFLVSEVSLAIKETAEMVDLQHNLTSKITKLGQEIS